MKIPLDLLDLSLSLRYTLIVATKKGGECMGIHKGTKLTDNPKDYMLRVRMDKETLQELDECCKAESISRSEVVRKGIKEQYEKLKK
nr:MAG TPA: hypothetical protein [Caudoviricetes sp.]